MCLVRSRLIRFLGEAPLYFFLRPKPTHQWCLVLRFTLRCALLHCSSHCIVLHCIVRCIVLLHYIPLYCIVLHCILLYAAMHSAPVLQWAQPFGLTTVFYVAFYCKYKNNFTCTMYPLACFCKSLILLPNLN